MAKAIIRYQLKVILHHIKPQIWRRIVVPANLTLWQLHAVLQVAMGWEESHLHSFTIKETEYGDPQNNESPMRKVLDEQVFQLERVIPKQVGFRFTYTYDFGDNWEHVLLVEKILPPEEGATLPVCLDGKRAGPLEDSGGAPGYLNLLESLQDPNHPQHEDGLEWAGEDFDPEDFNLEAINQELKQLAESDYELESLFTFDDDGLVFDDDFDMDLDEDLLDDLFEEEEITVEPEEMQAIVHQWIIDLPQELHQKCENMGLRKDFVTLLTYLRDHRVKGTEATGNLPLKAVRAINAGFVHPMAMEQEGQKVRSEEQAPDILFLHMLAYATQLADGGPGEQWVVTDNGLDFLDLTPGLQVLTMFLGWLVNMRWEMLSMVGVKASTPAKSRVAIIRLLTQQPTDTWLHQSELLQQIVQAGGWNMNDPLFPAMDKTFFQTALFMDLLLPMLSFEVIEFSQAAKLDLVEIRFTPLGGNMMGIVPKIIRSDL